MVRNIGEDCHRRRSAEWLCVAPHASISYLALAIGGHFRPSVGHGSAIWRGDPLQPGYPPDLLRQLLRLPWAGRERPASGSEAGPARSRVGKSGDRAWRPRSQQTRGQDPSRKRSAPHAPGVLGQEFDRAPEVSARGMDRAGCRVRASLGLHPTRAPGSAAGFGRDRSLGGQAPAGSRSRARGSGGLADTGPSRELRPYRSSACSRVSCRP